MSLKKNYLFLIQAIRIGTFMVVPNLIDSNSTKETLRFPRFPSSSPLLSSPLLPSFFRNPTRVRFPVFASEIWQVFVFFTLDAKIPKFTYVNFEKKTNTQFRNGGPQDI